MKMAMGRPTPKFFLEEQTFSSKKARRATPRSCPRPRSPTKSAQPVSRFFPKDTNTLKAQGVSFKSPDTTLRSKHYREDIQSPYFVQCFEVHGKLGAGSFGDVYKVKSREDGKFYAVKKARERFRGEADRLQKLEEVKKHEELPKHPNCNSFVRAWQEKGILYIQTELCQYSLANYSELNHDIPESVIWKYLVDLLMAVKHLHVHDLIHLDIKPENIFVSQDDVCKLGDFGLVLDLKKGDTSNALEGDPKYLAPELMDGKFTKAADIFSLGITILELACDLDLPRMGDSWHKLRQGQIPDQFFNCLSAELQQVIMLMMEPDYKKRPTVEEILKHPSVAKVLRRRCFELRLKSANQVALICWLWLCTVLRILFSPLRPLFGTGKLAICGDRPPNTPVRTPTHDLQLTSTWDNSFSDDELLDEGEMSGCSSMGIPLSESSTSGESHSNSLNGPISLFKKTKFSDGAIASPLSSVSVRWANRLMGKKSGHNTSCAGFPDPLPASSTPLHNSSATSPKDLTKASGEQKGTIGPRNLMDVFNDDDSEESM